MAGVRTSRRGFGQAGGVSDKSLRDPAPDLVSAGPRRCPNYRRARRLATWCVDEPWAPDGKHLVTLTPPECQLVGKLVALTTRFVVTRVSGSGIAAVFPWSVLWV